MSSSSATDPESPTGLAHCGLCGVLWTDHEVDPETGPMGLKVWVCRLPEEKFNKLLAFMEDESNWNKEIQL
jgi:hypothetical protein